MKTVNRLINLGAFKQLLAAYRPSLKSKAILDKTPIVLMVGPTAAGRNTLINILVDTGRYHFIVSDTTRKPRKNNGIMEQDGIEYWFKSEEQFLAGLESGKYLEAAIIHGQQVSGISVAELERAKLSGKIAIDEIEVDGASNIHGYNPNALFIFLVPPSFEVWMERLRGRGNMDDEELARRFRSAESEIETALKTDFYHFVINNEIHEAAVAVDELASGRLPDTEKQRQGRDHAEQLVVDIRLFLNNQVL